MDCCPAIEGTCVLMTTQTRAKLVRVRSLVVLSVPLATIILFLIHALRLRRPEIAILCGVGLAVIGGCTKIGSP